MGRRACEQPEGSRGTGDCTQHPRVQDARSLGTHAIYTPHLRSACGRGACGACGAVGLCRALAALLPSAVGQWFVVIPHCSGLGARL